MKKNFRIHTAALGVLLSATLVSNCSLLGGPATTDDDVLTLTALTGALGLLSGQCVKITKTTSSTTKQETYTAEGTKVPRGGCNEATLTGTFTTDSAVAVEAATGTSGVLTKMQNTIKDFTQCTQAGPAGVSNAALAPRITANNAASITTAATTAAATGAECANADTQSTQKFASVTYCKDDAAIAEFRARTRYVVVSDVHAVMAIDLNTKKAAAAASQATAGWTDSAIKNMQAMTTDDLTVINSSDATAPAFRAWVFAFGSVAGGIPAANAGACMLKLETEYAATLKPIFTKLMLTNNIAVGARGGAGGGATGSTAITTAEAAAVTQVVVPKLSCTMIRTAGSGVIVSDTCSNKLEAF